MTGLKTVGYRKIDKKNYMELNLLYKNQIENTFKKNLANLFNIINQKSKINIYTYQNSEDALKLVNLKKYNKIILISNIGTDLGGKIFVNNARNIIRNKVIALFNAYNINDLTWVQKYENALFCNNNDLFVEYFDCFYENNINATKEVILNFKGRLESSYKVKFNFNNYFLFYPYAESPNIKEFKDLIF